MGRKNKTKQNRSTKFFIASSDIFFKLSNVNLKSKTSFPLVCFVQRPLLYLFFLVASQSSSCFPFSDLKQTKTPCWPVPVIQNCPRASPGPGPVWIEVRMGRGQVEIDGGSRRGAGKPQDKHYPDQKFQQQLQ